MPRAGANPIRIAGTPHDGTATLHYIDPAGLVQHTPRTPPCRAPRAPWPRIHAAARQRQRNATLAEGRCAVAAGEGGLEDRELRVRGEPSEGRLSDAVAPVAGMDAAAAMSIPSNRWRR